MRMIALDPGTHCGYAIFENEFPVEFGTLHGEEEIYHWLKQQVAVDLFVVEDYKIRPVGQKGFNHSWSNVFPAQVIGAIKFHATTYGIPVVLQQPSIKAMGSKMAFNEEYKKRGDNHDKDAVIHGVYYLRVRKNQGA